MTRHTFADDELTALLERAIPPGPEGPALSVVVRAGGQALRRRRLAVGSAVAAAAVVAGSGAAVALGGSRPVSDLGPAVDSPPTQTAQPGPPLATDDTVSLDDFLGSDLLVELRPGGLLRVRPGVEVVRWVDNPVGRTAPSHSMGLVLRYQGTTSWALLDYRDLGDGVAGSGGASTTPADESGTFDAWLAEQVALAQQPPPEQPDSPLGDDPGAPLVELRADGTLDLAPGVEVLERIDDPADQTLPNRSVAVAFTYQGRERWAVLQVLVDDDGRITGGGAATTYADRAEPLDSLAAYAEANDQRVYHP